jgi:hypothetical protein
MLISWTAVEWQEIKEFATTQIAGIRTKDLAIIEEVIYLDELPNADDGVPCGYGIVKDTSRLRLGTTANEQKVAFYVDLQYARYRDKVVEGPNVSLSYIIGFN